MKREETKGPTKRNSDRGDSAVKENDKEKKKLKGEKFKRVTEGERDTETKEKFIHSYPSRDPLIASNGFLLLSPCIFAPVRTLCASFWFASVIILFKC